MRETTETVRMLMVMLADAWRSRRNDEGGITDETAIMGLMAGVAIAVGAGVTALLTGAVDRIDLGF